MNVNVVSFKPGEKTLITTVIILELLFVCLSEKQ